MANYLATDTDLTAVANAIRAKSGGSGSLAFPAGFVSAIGDIPTGGGGYNINDLATNSEPSGAVTITAGAIAAYVFYGKQAITSVSAPNAVSIGDHAFDGTSLSSASFPAVKSGGDRILGNKTSITTIDGSIFPLLETCTASLFNGNTKPTSVTLPKWTGLGYTSASATNNFRSMTNLVTLNLPNCIYVGGYECSFDTNLTTVRLGATSTHEGDKIIGVNAFNGSTKLNVLVLYGNVVWTLNNINAFTNTPFASGSAGGTLYVPSALISSYQSATNWSTILGYSTNSIAAIEGSAYE